MSKQREFQFDASDLDEGLPEFGAIARDARKEVEQRLLHARAVPDAVGRDAVRSVQGMIAQGFEHIRQGADAMDLVASLVGVVSEREGPHPFLSRLLAVTAIAETEATNGLVFDPSSQIGVELLEAMASEPYPRGGLMLQGAREGTKIRLGMQVDAQKTRELPNLGSPDEVDRYTRGKMLDATRNLFTTSPPLSLLLREWRVVHGIHPLAGSHPGGLMVPSHVMKLKALRTGGRGKGSSRSDEFRFHVCSEDHQELAVAWGMPPSGQYATAVTEERNPTAIVSASSLIVDDASGEPGIRIRGVGVDALYVMDEGRQDALREKMNGMLEGLTFTVACSTLPADGLSSIIAARVLRRLHRNWDDPRTQRTHVFGAIDTEMRRLSEPFLITRFEGGQPIDRKEGSILSSYTQEFNQRRGKLEGRFVTEEEAASSLRLAVQGLLCTVEHGLPAVRKEGDVVRTARAVIRRGIPVTDQQTFPSLANADDVLIETIYRRTVPPGVHPPLEVGAR